jgi:type IV secretory pathway VirB10-like protein
MRVGSWIVRLGACAVLALSASGCAKARAASVPDGPPLSVPQPPERVLAPVEPPPPVAVAAPEPAPPPPPAAVRTPPRPAPPREAEQRPQPAPPVVPAQGDSRDLRPAAAANSAAAERAVREVLMRATRDLGRIAYTRLSADGRAQYDQAKRFTQQAEQALKDRNLVFATTLADKAATLAAELLGR